MMRNPIRGVTLVLLIAVFCLMGRATAKLTKRQQSHTGVTGEQSDVTAQRTGELLQGQTITALTREGIPESEAKVDVPIQNLLNLPDGAGYTTKDGQASVSVQRHGDNITVKGKCDSIARQCLFYEREVGDLLLTSPLKKLKNRILTFLK